MMLSTLLVQFQQIVAHYLTTDKKLINTPIPEIKILNPVIFVNEMEE